LNYTRRVLPFSEKILAHVS